MTPRLVQLVVDDVRVPVRLEAFCQFALLLDREQRVGLDAHDERGMVPQPRESPRQVRQVGVRRGQRRDERFRLRRVARRFSPFWRRRVRSRGGGGRRCARLLDCARCLRRRQHSGVACGPSSLEVGQSLLAHVEEVHRFRDVDKRVGVVLEAEELALMVEVGLDQKVGAKDRRRRDMRFESGRIKGVRGGCEVSSPTTKSLLPLWSRTVGDRGDFCRSGGVRQFKRLGREPRISRR